MPFVKLIKNKAYFKRYQVKYRRRREGKTDYYARKRLVVQDKNKYNSPKYRFVVRITNKDIIAQISYAKVVGDVVLCAAYSHELPKYGIKLGLTNFAAAYSTGLLLARRVLTNLKLHEKYPGVKEANGVYGETKKPEDKKKDFPRPFKVFLDTGLTRTTTGSKIFGALKGLSDGGIYIPHKERRFVGYDSETGKFDASVLRKYIFAGHIAEYMKELKEEEPEKYKKQFSRYIKEGIDAGKLEKIYKDAHAAIRKDPAMVKTKKPEKPVHKKYNKRKLTYHERKEGVRNKLLALRQHVDQL
jgi:large subunit ribosomal protein L5e